MQAYICVYIYVYTRTYKYTIFFSHVHVSIDNTDFVYINATAVYIWNHQAFVWDTLGCNQKIQPQQLLGLGNPPPKILVGELKPGFARHNFVKNNFSFQFLNLLSCTCRQGSPKKALELCAAKWIEGVNDRMLVHPYEGLVHLICAAKSLLRC